MQTLSLASPDLNVYFLIYKNTKGYNPVAQHWALECLLKELQPYILRLSNLILKRTKPLSKTEQYVHGKKVDKYWKDDLIQDINLCVLFVLRKHKLRNTSRFHDYMNLVLRELFNGGKYSLNRACSES